MMKELWELDVIIKNKISFDYVNWKGERAERKAFAINLLFDSTKWHKEKQFLLLALDLDKQQPRLFALKDMSNIKILEG
jgi:predicted DNA-binding transcriptional regulator YafY